jgi:hypothetical protein
MENVTAESAFDSGPLRMEDVQEILAQLPLISLQNLERSVQEGLRATVSLSRAAMARSYALQDMHSSLAQVRHWIAELLVLKYENVSANISTL